MTLGSHIRHLILAHSSFGSPYKGGQSPYHTSALFFFLIFLPESYKPEHMLP